MGDRKPMCDRWYERSAGIRPWEEAMLRLEGCRCGVGSSRPASAHGHRCPVRQSYERELSLVLPVWP